MSKNLLGIEVDDAVYENYNNKTYVVKNNPNGEKALSLRVIMIYANSKEYQEHFPEFSNECNKIVAEVKNEIGGKLYYLVQKHDKFSEYIVDLKAVQKQCAEKRRTLEKELDEARQEFADVEEGNSLNEYQNTEAKLKFLKVKQDYDNALDELTKSTIEQMNKIENEFNVHLSDFYTANGSHMDENIVRLLNSGLKLESDEVTTIVKQNVNNPTMLRLIDQYCTTNKIDSSSARTYGNMAKSAGKNEKRIFKEAASVIEYMLSRDKNRSFWWDESSTARNEQLMEQCIVAMDSLLVKP